MPVPENARIHPGARAQHKRRNPRRERAEHHREHRHPDRASGNFLFFHVGSLIYSLRFDYYITYRALWQARYIGVQTNGSSVRANVSPA